VAENDDVLELELELELKLKLKLKLKRTFKRGDGEAGACKRYRQCRWSSQLAGQPAATVDGCIHTTARGYLQH